MTADPWGEVPTSDGFAKWENAGDSVSGRIVAKEVGLDLNGNKVPQLVVDTADGPVTVTASQAQLKARLLELKPNVGDAISITYDGNEKREGGKTLKKFTVVVSGAAEVPAAAPAVPAGLEGLDAETLAKLQALQK